MSDHATTDTREIIVEILLSLEKGQDFSHKLMKAVLDKYDYLDPREKAFIKRVTEGTIERQLELDYYLDRFSSVPILEDEASDPLSSSHEYLSDPVYGRSSRQCGVQ